MHIRLHLMTLFREVQLFSEYTSTRKVAYLSSLIDFFGKYEYKEYLDQYIEVHKP